MMWIDLEGMQLRQWENKGTEITDFLIKKLFLQIE